MVSFNAIICCNIPLDPVFKEKKLKWLLLVPITVIQTLNNEQPLKLQAVSTTIITKKKVQPSFISIMNFTGKDDFEKFVFKIAK